MDKKNILNESISVLDGIGQKRAELFRTLGVFTVSDLLTFYPRGYEDRTKLKKLAELDPEGTKRFMERNGIRQRDVPKQKQKKKQRLQRER